MTKVVITGDMYYSDLGIGGGPIIPQPGVPTHPIVIPPDAIGPGVPSHPIYIPVYPSHPIVIPPDGLAPGTPTHPIYIPVYPSHPIVIPPNAVGPGLPEHPIVLPPAGPVDPGYSPPWARPGGGPVDPGWSGGIAPVDPGYSPPWARPGGGPVDPGYGIDAGFRPTHPIYNPAYPSHPIVIPPEAIVPDPDGKAHVVVYYGGQRITFTVEMPERTPPTEPEPKA